MKCCGMMCSAVELCTVLWNDVQFCGIMYVGDTSSEILSCNKTDIYI